MATFVDMFAGAGGFSEGFLQAEGENGKHFDFILAGDINPTCELTHRKRYNEQLGLDTQFLTKDISDPDYIEVLRQKMALIDVEEVDVLTGGPPCQSFSLAGERRKNDKKDDLFSYYLKVIEDLRPKYFVMENVEGILTKDKGKIKDRILKEIRNIVDYKALESLLEFISCENLLISDENRALFGLCTKLLSISIEQHKLKEERRDDYLHLLEVLKNSGLSDNELEFAENALLQNKLEITNRAFTNLCKELDNKFVEAFRNSTISETDRNVVRQALLLISHEQGLYQIRERIKREISASKLKDSVYKTAFDVMTDELDFDNIVDIAIKQCSYLTEIVRKVDDDQADITTMIDTLEYLRNAFMLISGGVSETISTMISLIDNDDNPSVEGVKKKAQKVSLYRIEKPLPLLASDYGVPQNRVRVAFIGCRNDQKTINKITEFTQESADKITAQEAIGDLEGIGIPESVNDYNPETIRTYESSSSNRRRTARGVPEEKAGNEECHTYAEWCRIGRLNRQRFNIGIPTYTRANSVEEENPSKDIQVLLPNHETSNHTPEVQRRYMLIRECGGFEAAKRKFPKEKILTGTKKRNYTVVDPNLPSTTITTMPDDFVHYNENRSLTVREMARLQSFDDSFVFQGKRSTGGDKRKTETPQFTQVGNAVPPLLARAIAEEILDKLPE